MIRSPIKWVGGKSRLRKTILSLIPQHTCYVEVFGGAGWVLFAKEPSKVEIYNDIDSELVNFFQVIKTAPDEVLESFEWDLVSREVFNRLLNLDTTELSPIQRAHRFYYIIMASWGGELGSARFQTSTTDAGHGNRLVNALRKARERIRPAHERLQTVIIEHLSWVECIERYDSSKSFLYLDPPYPNNNCNYQYNMRSISDHELLFEHLKNAESQWLLSTYDTDEMRELVSGYNIQAVTFQSGMSGNGYKNKEILVMNYSLPESTE